MTRFAVVGCGGIGGYIAGVLSRCGYWVALLARNQHLQAIQSQGLDIETPSGRFNVIPGMVTDRADTVGAVDAIILAVKTWQVPDAIPILLPLLGPTTRVLILQNGVETYAQLERALGSSYPLMGVCWMLGQIVAPGRIRHVGVEPAITLGERKGQPISRSAALVAEALAASGFKIQVSDDIEASVWEKWIFVAAVSGIGAVTRGTFGEVWKFSETRELLRDLMLEVFNVGRAEHIQLSDDVVDWKLKLVATMPPHGTPSMQRDIMSGKPSELETIIGAIIRLGRKHGIPTPTAKYVCATLLPQEAVARTSRLLGNSAV
jgi:2-dehydropantoate 2-reductase